MKETEESSKRVRYYCQRQSTKQYYAVVYNFKVELLSDNLNMS